MATLTSKTVVAVNHVAIDNQSTANTRPQSVHGKMLHTFGASVDHFTDGCSIGIVGQRHRFQRRKLCLDQFNQGDNAFERQIRGMFDGTRIEIAVGRTNTDASDDRLLVEFVHGIHHVLNGCSQVCHIGVHITVSWSGDVTFHHDVACTVHHAHGCVGSSYVNTYS